MQTATFAGGCFWCTEAVFQHIKGVQKVVSGYTGGQIKNPAYREVCSGRTGHAEAVQITFDDSVTDFHELLEVFFATHDPTTLNRQGNDVGTQYRSAVFYHNAHQKEVTRQYIQQLENQQVFKGKIVTEVAPFTVFYEAEAEHQNYYSTHSEQPYCQYVIVPKLKTLAAISEGK